MSATIIYLVVLSGFAGSFSFLIIKWINLMFYVCRMVPFAFSHLNQPFTSFPSPFLSRRHFTHPQPPFIPLYFPSIHSFKSAFSRPKTVTNKRLDWCKQLQSVNVTRKHWGVDPIWTSQRHTLGHRATNVTQISPRPRRGPQGMSTGADLVCTICN